MVMNAIDAIEEARCDRLAGEILVPSDTLLQLTRDRLAHGSWLSCFSTVLRELSDRFNVSMQCILSRLAKNRLPSGFYDCFACLICSSRGSGRVTLGHEELRVHTLVRGETDWEV